MRLIYTVIIRRESICGHSPSVLYIFIDVDTQEETGLPRQTSRLQTAHRVGLELIRVKVKDESSLIWPVNSRPQTIGLTGKTIECLSHGVPRVKKKTWGACAEARQALLFNLHRRRASFDADEEQALSPVADKAILSTKQMHKTGAK